jgi:hypothetical protein
MQKQNILNRQVLGVGEYGCWECTMVTDVLGENETPDKLWVVARSLQEIVNSIPGIESGILLGRGTCIADAKTPGIKED